MRVTSDPYRARTYGRTVDGAPCSFGGLYLRFFVTRGFNAAARRITRTHVYMYGVSHEIAATAKALVNTTGRGGSCPRTSRCLRSIVRFQSCMSRARRAMTVDVATDGSGGESLRLIAHPVARDTLYDSGELAR